MKYSKLSLAAIIISSVAILISLAAIAIGSFAVFASFRIIRGNGDIVPSERIVPAFEKINIRGSTHVRFHISQEHRVVVTTDSNIIEFVTTTVRNNTLNIGIESGNYSFTKLTVDVYSPVLTGVSISGSGRFSSNDTITVPVFETNVSGSGTITAIVESETFSSRVSGSGRMIVSGNSNDSNIVISGSGRFNGNEFINNNADVNISGSGTVNIFVTNNLNARVSGSGRINYRGNPSSVNANVSGSGRINRSDL